MHLHRRRMIVPAHHHDDDAPPRQLLTPAAQTLQRALLTLKLKLMLMPVVYR